MNTFLIIIIVLCILPGAIRLANALMDALFGKDD